LALRVQVHWMCLALCCAFALTASWLQTLLPRMCRTSHHVLSAVRTDCRHFISSSRLHAERAIPASLLQNAAGYAILSVLKVGMGWSAAVGTGLVVARLEDGSWSPPSAVGLGSFGWGLQAGGEMTDLLLVLNNTETVKARFCRT
jgi:lipid-binding SYLF domain-containing protein